MVTVVVMSMVTVTVVGTTDEEVEVDWVSQRFASVPRRRRELPPGASAVHEGLAISEMWAEREVEV